jgi:ubiquinone/menaquinone biosynthesis C-methylase UbiE
MTTTMTPATTRPSLHERFNAAIYEPFLALGERRGAAARRAELLGDLAGRVLEIGAGTGLNLPHYPASVTELVLTEPDAGMVARLRRRVARRPDAAGTGPAAVRVVAAPAESLWFADGAFDAVVSTMVLCTVTDPEAALAEATRVLRPGGRLVLLEHVLAPDAPRLARRQHRLAGPWAAFAAGCRCDQDTTALLAAAGYDVRGLHAADWRGMPRIVRPLVVGSLERPGGPE